MLGNALGAAAAASLIKKLSRDGGNPEVPMHESMAKAREIAAQFPRLRARLDTAAAADYASTPENTFGFGLQAILDGLETRLSARSTPTGRDPREAHRHYQEPCATSLTTP